VSRHFNARAMYDGRAASWFGVVYADNYSHAPYWRGARLTHPGAAFAAWRRARKLNRLAARGKLL
jgi:hypothetical protein